MSDALSQLNIVIVDDDPFILKLLTRQFENLGCRRVTAYERAQDAIAAIERSTHRVHAIFCDLDMPVMDGVEFVRHLVRLGFNGGLVLISGADERILAAAEELARAHGLQVHGALPKPVSAGKLGAVLEEIEAAAETAAPRRDGRPYVVDDVRQAIDNGDLYCDFQPKVEIATGRVAGVESLVRWRHERDGVIYPDQFVGVAEQHGLMGALTCFVLTHSLQQCRAWREAGLDLNVAVNISMGDLEGVNFPDIVIAKVSEQGLDVDSLTLEVTESLLMSDRRTSLDVLTRLRLKRIGVSIDDFGTGHSSLAQLRDVPFDELKIDRGFVHGAAEDASRRAIFNASVGMASQLGLRTVAEGVEDAQDWQFLRASGCELAQGYFIARPMAPEAVGPWVEQWAGGFAELAAD